MKLTLFLALIAIVSYALGALNGAIITSLNIFRRDVRRYGSRNAGLTNFTRVFGLESAIFVILVDVVKTVISVLFGRWLLGTLGYPTVGALFSGFCVMVGHVFPIYYRFKGGKAVLCGSVMVWMVDWRVALVCWCVFFVLVIFSKYVSLGSLGASVVMPLSTWIFGHNSLDIILSLLCALLVIYAHRENIVRLITGNESKLNLGGSSGSSGSTHSPF